MNDFWKYAGVALVAYYIGFYECKNRVQNELIVFLKKADREPQENKNND